MIKEMDLTVAICVYNGARYIEEALDSLAKQTYNQFLLLIVDDGSRDNTMEIIQKYLEKSTFIKNKVIICPSNGGLAVARNIALKETTTKYMMFFDADDIAESCMVEKMISKLRSDNNLIVIGCYASMIDENGTTMIGGVHAGHTDRDTALECAKNGKLFFLPTCAMFRVEEANLAGGISVEGFPSGKTRYADLCEDCDRWTRMSDLYKLGKYLMTIPENLFRYRKHTNTMSNDNYNMLQRMRHIKNNTSRRRIGLADLTFIEFERTLSAKEKKTLHKEAEASVLIRNAGFSVHRHNFLSAVIYSVRAILKNPKYVYDKTCSIFRRNK